MLATRQSIAKRLQFSEPFELDGRSAALSHGHQPTSQSEHAVCEDAEEIDRDGPRNDEVDPFIDPPGLGGRLPDFHIAQADRSRHVAQKARSLGARLDEMETYARRDHRERDAGKSRPA